MATKTKKNQAKPKKSVAKKVSTAKKVVKAAAPKKKPVKAVTKKSIPAKKATAKKTTVAKKAPAKKPTAKATKAVKTVKVVKAAKKPVPKAAASKSATPKKTNKAKTVTTAKKPLRTVKKVESVKTIAKKPTDKKSTDKKPNLKIVVSNKEKVQPITKNIVNKPAEKIKTTSTASIGAIEKGVKKRIMDSLEVKQIKPSSAGLFGVSPYEEKSDEEYMNETQKNHFREILRRWKKELMEEVDRTKSHMQDGATRHPDPSDNATQEEEFNLELRTRDRERKLIKKIDESLERIDHDEYGYCFACGIEIGIRRLEARPTAEMCIDCKTLDEIKEKQTRG